MNSWIYVVFAQITLFFANIATYFKYQLDKANAGKNFFPIDDEHTYVIAAWKKNKHKETYFYMFTMYSDEINILRYLNASGFDPKNVSFYTLEQLRQKTYKTYHEVEEIENV